MEKPNLKSLFGNVAIEVTKEQKPKKEELSETQKEYLKKPLEYLEKLSSTKNINTTIIYQTLCEIFNDLLEFKQKSKFLKISIEDQKFQKRVLQTSSSTVKLLEYIGYNFEEIIDEEDNVEGFFILSKIDNENLELIKNEIQNRLDISLAARKNWKNAISSIKTVHSMKNLMRKISSDNFKKEEKKEEKTVEIDGKILKRPILRTFHVSKDDATFEVSEKYEVKKVLGFGAYGVVVLAYDHELKKNVAIKKIFNTFQQDIEYQKRILREIKLMIHFNGHPNIVNILDLIPPKNFDEFNDIYIVMDCMDQDLAKLIKERKPYNEEVTKKLFYQILLGLYTIHNSFVLHRDIKPSNILIDTKNENQCRICDFGLSRGMDATVDPHMSTLYVVTRYYRSPELCCDYEKSYKPLDMWSMGCVFAEMLQKPTRKPLFPGDSTLKQLKLILDICGKQDEENVKGVENAKLFVKENGKKDKVVWEKYPKFRHVKNEGKIFQSKYSFFFKDAYDLLDKMLEFNPEKRMTIEDALKHNYFKDIYSESDLKLFDKFDYRFDDSVTLEQDPDYVKKMLYDSIMNFNKELGIGGDALISELDAVDVE